MLKLLQSILFKTSEEMTFYKLYTNMVKWRSSGFPSPYQLPQRIVFPSDFWKKIVKLYKETRSDEMERAISLFWVDGELVLTSTTKGNRKQVTSNNTVTYRYVPSKTKPNYYDREILVNDKVYSSKRVYKDKIPKKLKRPEYLFNLHTHPPHVDNGITSYSFFSLQDIKSMLSSRAVITGVVTDRLWLLFRTNRTPDTIGDMQEIEITKESLQERLHIGVYQADFNSKLTLLPELNSNTGTTHNE